MQTQIVTRFIGLSAMRAELAFLVQHLQQVGYEYCEVLFGFAWGNDYYPTSKWDYVRFPVAGLTGEVERVEAAGMGCLGADDLFVLLPDSGVKFCFCHENDLHLSSISTDGVHAFFFRRWLEMGFVPSEWEMTEEGKRSRLLDGTNSECSQAG